MTDRIQELLDHTADQLAAGMVTPPFAAGHHERSRRPHGWLRPVLAAAAVIAIVGGISYLTEENSTPSTSYAGSPPELGTTTLPRDVSGSSFLLDLTRDHGRPTGHPELLARVRNSKGEGVLVAQPFSDGFVCMTFGYLPPTVNMGGGGYCVDPDKEPPYASQPLAISGEGPSGAPGGPKDPAVIFGGAPPGTRSVVLSRPGVEAVTAPAYDGGGRYRHRAYFAATWDLGAGNTLARALDGDGRELARLERPGFTPEQVAQQCSSIREVLSSHFSNAVEAGRRWASLNPETSDATRLRYPARGEMTDEAAVARFSYALEQRARIGQGELAEYRSAANAVLGEAQCFPGTAVQRAAARFKAQTR